MSLMSSSRLLHQCLTCLVCLTWIVFVMGGKQPYSCCFVGCWLQDLNINWTLERSELNSFKYSKSLNSSIWPIDATLTGATTLDENGPGSNGNEGILYKRWVVLSTQWLINNGLLTWLANLGSCPRWEADIFIFCLSFCSRKNFIHLYIRLIAELGRKIYLHLCIRFTDKSNQMIYFQLCVRLLLYFSFFSLEKN